MPGVTNWCKVLSIFFFFLLRFSYKMGPTVFNSKVKSKKKGKGKKRSFFKNVLYH